MTNAEREYLKKGIEHSIKGMTIEDAYNFIKTNYGVDKGYLDRLFIPCITSWYFVNTKEIKYI